jgi:hypothetical protein
MKNSKTIVAVFFVFIAALIIFSLHRDSKENIIAQDRIWNTDPNGWEQDGEKLWINPSPEVITNGNRIWYEEQGIREGFLVDPKSGTFKKDK